MANKSVEMCVASLSQAKTVTEKMAGLFLITKILKAEEIEPSDLKQLFAAIDWAFIKLLVKSSDNESSMYKSIALSTLSVFCRVPELCKSLSDFIPELLDMALSADSEDDLLIMSDTYDCLEALLATKEGRKIAVENKAVEKLVRVYDVGMFKDEEALQLIVKLSKVESEGLFHRNPETFQRLLNRLSSEFAKEIDDKKFAMASEIAHILRCMPSDVPKTFFKDWPAVICNELMGVLCSKITYQQRDPALILASQMIENFGFEYLQTEGKITSQFLFILVNLACIEIRMIIEDRSLEQIVQNSRLLMASFSIIESFIVYMGTPTYEKFDEKQKEQVYAALGGAETAVVCFLLKFKDENKQTSKLMSNTETTCFVAACIRVLSVWLTEDPHFLPDDVDVLLPFLVEYSIKCFEKNNRELTSLKKQSTTKWTSSLPDPLRLLLPAILILMPDNARRKMLIEMDLQRVLLDYAKYQWRLFRDWQKEQLPTPSDWLGASLSGDTRLFSDDESAGREVPESEAAIISICTVFMNFVSMEPFLINDDPAFKAFLKFVFSCVGDINKKPEYVVLLGNFVVSGIMLLRYLPAEDSDPMVFNFISSCVRFFWDAIDFEESNDRRKLVISIRYKRQWPELAEMWILGMGTLAKVIENSAWVGDFVVDSGFSGEIMKMLQNVMHGEIDIGTKTALEDLLSSLGTKRLNSRDLLKVARRHGMSMLSKMTQAEENEK
ncbi:neurochondrin homolog [Artemia franciscana]|uniref:Neurochondrin-like protein n=1 Tax=Artemia franciscana TaxID=6661 RepID=A0AA88LJ28_ARTSF|nr:hypothetical protein QYM36_000204 [Artemia franciscana]